MAENEGERKRGLGVDATVIWLPDKRDHVVVAIVLAERLPPCFPVSVPVTYRSFPPPTLPRRTNNFLFPKEFTELSYKILPLGGSIFPILYAGESILCISRPPSLSPFLPSPHFIFLCILKKQRRLYRAAFFYCCWNIFISNLSDEALKRFFLHFFTFLPCERIDAPFASKANFHFHLP